jgi:lipopolysaccharide/colanic/teichoic acid biosynthesis glycosyltransferase
MPPLMPLFDTPRHKHTHLAAARRTGEDAAYDLRTLKDHQADFMESQPHPIILIGPNGKDFANNLADLNYKGVALASTTEMQTWLNELPALDPLEIPRAIICEINLQDGDVYAIFEKIKLEERLKTVPFILVSESDDKEHKVKALRMGIDDFYLFPLSFKDLHKRIVFLQQFKRQKAKLQNIDETLYKERIPLSKRIFDIFFSTLALLMLSPLFIVVAFLIKVTSKGPVFYTSKRVGTGYKIFDFYKFRSMRVGADAELAKLKHLNQYSGGNGAFIKIANDPRITGIGNFIRKTSIDELPQLLNVLKGDMSIVGNRPLPLYEAEQLTVDRWSKRFLAPAGITGLWQVTKRGKKEMSEEERMELDIIYAKKYSLLFDLQIILRTFPALLQKEKV